MNEADKAHEFMNAKGMRMRKNCKVELRFSNIIFKIQDTSIQRNCQQVYHTLCT